MNNKQHNIAQRLKQIAGQKFTWFALLVGSLTITAFNTKQENSPFAATETAVEEQETLVLTRVNNNEIATTEFDKADIELPKAERITPAFTAEANEENISKFLRAERAVKSSNSAETAEAIVEYAQTLMGTPYNYGGTTTDGFDCSGFVYHVFSKFGQEIERSSRTQSVQGELVDVEEAQPGDLLFFTGTNPSIREVGHVGIVISEQGEPVSFVHSSSNGGVKISELEGYYNTRFMAAKRML